MNKMPPVVVVYKTSNRKNAKLKLEVYHDVRVDDILDTNKRKPIIPYESEILEIGIGRGFEEKYKKKYKL